MSEHPSSSHPAQGAWQPVALPSNARVGANTLVSGELAFKRFRSQVPDALVIGANCTMDGVHFALGQQGRVAKLDGVTEVPRQGCQKPRERLRERGRPATAFRRRGRKLQDEGPRVVRERAPERQDHVLEESIGPKEIRIRSALARKLEGRDCRRGLGAARESRRELAGVSKQVALGDRRVEAPVDPHGAQKRMLRVFPQPFPGELALARASRVDDSPPAREAPGARPEKDVGGESLRDRRRFRVFLLETLRVRRDVPGRPERLAEEVQLARFVHDGHANTGPVAG